MENVIHLKDFEVSTIVAALRERYQCDQIYTSIGSILVAINPFKVLPLYTHDVLQTYAQAGASLPDYSPHAYKTAALAYKGIKEYGLNQSIIISGESGAGKTETAKLLLEYLSEVAGGEKNIAPMIMAGNPLLEAFGNAKTVRNNNSSRFGKFINVAFESTEMCISGAKIDNYLLEKTRVVTQTSSERNYHVFYQFCEGAEASVKRELNLLSAKDFHYLNQGSLTYEGARDGADWDATVRAMEDLSFSKATMSSIFSLLAAVLHLGNIKFQPDAKDHASVVNRPTLVFAARLMKIELVDVERALCFRSLRIQGLVNMIPLSPAQAIQARDALAKALYGNLFDWVVNTMNQTLAPKAVKNAGFIGVLDIFGFEVFENNSLEQCFINYANEKLQQQFNRFIFKMEQDEYKEEGIRVDFVTFVDNLEVCELIEKKGGILRMIDEEGVIPGGSDERLLAKLVQAHSKHAHFATIRKRPECFVIRHYAGDVAYDVNGFVSKNKFQVSEELASMSRTSKDSLIRTLFPINNAKSEQTLSFGFQQSLTDLYATLSATNPNFVRCIKPNNEKMPNKFEQDLITTQMNNAGLFRAIQVRKAGYSHRMEHKEFFLRFRCLLMADDFSHTKAWKEGCVAIHSFLSSRDPSFYVEMQVGKTKIFWRSNQAVIIDRMREDALLLAVLRLQRFGAVARARAKLRFRREINKKCISATNSRDISFAREVIELAAVNDIEMKSVAQLRELVATLEAAKVRCDTLSHLLSSSTDIEVLQKEMGVAMKFNMERMMCAELVVLVGKAEQKIRDLQIRAHGAQIRKKLQRHKTASRLTEEVQTWKKSLSYADLQHATMQEILSETEMKIQDLQQSEEKEEAEKQRLLLLMKEKERLEKEANEEKLIQEKKKQKEDEEKAEKEKLMEERKRQEEFYAQNRKLTLESASPTHRKLTLESAYYPPITIQRKLTLESAVDDEVKKHEEKYNNNNTNDDEKALVPSFPKRINSPPPPPLPAFSGKSPLYSSSLTPPSPVTFLSSSNVPFVDRSTTYSPLSSSPPPIERATTEPVSSFSLHARPFATSPRSPPPRPTTIKQRGLPSRAEAVKNLLILCQEQKGLHPLSSLTTVLRSPQDYAKGFSRNKTTKMKGMLRWQKTPIIRSLTLPPIKKSNNNKNSADKQGNFELAVALFSDLLGFMKDVAHPYPTSLGQELVRRGCEEPDLRDELYVQVMKQTTENPTKESTFLGWKLLLYYLHCFAPSPAIEMCVLDHICGVAHVRYIPPISLSTANISDLASLCLIAFVMVVQPTHITYLPTIRQITDATQFVGNGRDLNHDHFYQWTNVVKNINKNNHSDNDNSIMKKVTSNLAEMLELAEDAEVEENPKGKGGFFSRKSKRTSLAQNDDNKTENSNSEEHVRERKTSMIYNPDSGFDVKSLPKSYKSIFKNAGIKKQDLQDKENASKIFDAIRSVAPSVVGEDKPAPVSDGKQSGPRLAIVSRPQPPSFRMTLKKSPPPLPKPSISRAATLSPSSFSSPPSPPSPLTSSSSFVGSPSRRRTPAPSPSTSLQQQQRDQPETLLLTSPLNTNAKRNSTPNFIQKNNNDSKVENSSETDSSFEHPKIFPPSDQIKAGTKLQHVSKVVEVHEVSEVAVGSLVGRLKSMAFRATNMFSKKEVVHDVFEVEEGDWSSDDYTLYEGR